FKINFVGHKRFINLGKLLVLHGHEYRWGGNPLVSPARWLWLRTKENSICGHFHQHGEYSENTARGRIITAWTVGNLSTLTPDFMPYNNWTNGFAFVDVDKDGAFNVENYKF